MPHFRLVENNGWLESHTLPHKKGALVCKHTGEFIRSKKIHCVKRIPPESPPGPTSRFVASDDTPIEITYFFCPPCAKTSQAARPAKPPELVSHDEFMLIEDN